MRIGRRWRADARPPAGVPAELAAATARAEVAPEGWWTLTWLEGRAIAEHDDGLLLAQQRDGSIRAEPGASPDDGQDAEGEYEDEDEDELFPA